MSCDCSLAQKSSAAKVEEKKANPFCVLKVGSPGEHPKACVLMGTDTTCDCSQLVQARKCVLKGTTTGSGCVEESTFTPCDCPMELLQVKAKKCVLAGMLEPRGCVEEGSNVQCECPYPVITPPAPKKIE